MRTGSTSSSSPPGLVPGARPCSFRVGWRAITGPRAQEIDEALDVTPWPSAFQVVFAKLPFAANSAERAEGGRFLSLFLIFICALQIMNVIFVMS